MADGERKRLVWAIKKDLLSLSANHLFQIAKSLIPIPEMDQSQLESADEEVCFVCIQSFMHSKTLLESEDSGMAHLLELRDVVIVTMKSCVPESQMWVTDDNVSHTPFVNPQVNVVRSEKNLTYDDVVDITDDETSEDANTNHLPATTATCTYEAEFQKMLTSYEELSKKIMQYMPTSTAQPTFHSRERYTLCRNRGTSHVPNM